ncbi:MAG TPA: CPBP family intramembrane glutamic endopeptidase [Polyangiaceae bacterium]|nr:CPBP family intramembrane glutamic endopeptidase [Polyangiaceae bacterium]
MRTLQELRAIALLVLRSWYRMGPRLRGGRKPEPTRGISAVLMRLVFAALIYNFGFTSGMRVAQHSAPTWAATWAGLGAGCFMLATTFALELPSARMPTQALKSELLELLPLSRSSKLILALAQASLTLPVAIGLATTLHVQLAPGASLLGAVLLALLLFVVFGLLGSCAGKLLRLSLSAYRASRLAWFSSLPLLGGVLLLQLAPTLDKTPRPPFGDALGRALVGQDVAQTSGVLGAIALLLGAAFFRLERGYELAEPVRPGPTPSAFNGGVDLPLLERVLNRREPGGSFQLPFATLFSAVFIGLLSWKLPKHEDGRLVWNFAALITLQMTSTIGMQRATRGATRDMLARPLLGALPLAPRDTLRSKASALTRSLLLIAAPISLVLGSGFGSKPLFAELWWRVAAALVAVWIYASAATYVAFLTAGLGSTRPRGGVFGSLESFLLAIPFASVLFAPGPGSAALSILTLGALTFEARRAALGTIDWLDDPEREHATEVWKALVVFGGFQGTQLLTQQLALAFGGEVSKTVKLLGAYSVAALVLWLMTQREQESGSPKLLWRLAPLGLVAGALSAAGAWLYLHVLPPSALDGATPFEAKSTVSALCLIFTIAGVAPVVEERFFRGWLQPALESTLGERRYLAPIFTALAFAAAHPAYSFVPVLVLGLLNGFLMLRFRSLSACMLAHALHNAFALYLGSR